ncbi:MAG: MFS transporter [Proteobacteria bacterium]|nr:MFS transporter [Pseudomonadota bacterium]
MQGPKRPGGATALLEPTGRASPAHPTGRPGGDSGAGRTSTRARNALNTLNFFLAAMQTGFGPFVPVFLTGLAWSQTDIGLALTIGTIAAIASQLPAGALVDAVPGKRGITGLALGLTALSALLLAAWPRPGPGFIAQIWSAQVLHAVAGSALTPAIAALTLGMCGHEDFSAQLGGNARYASLGAVAAAGLLGVFATWQSDRAVFLATAALALPALAALAMLRPGLSVRGQEAPPRDHPAMLPPAARRRGRARPWRIFQQLHLHTFAVCVLLFQLANAAMLPLALNTLAQRGAASGLVVSASVIVPQAVVAAGSPWVGRAAQRIGRRRLLIVGFAAVPVRGVLLATLPGAAALVGMEALDGISATIFGIMLPLIAADLTRRSGYLNLAIGSLGLAGGIGAAISTVLAGWIADRAGAPAALLALAAAGAVAWIVILLAMPETRPAAGAAAPAT